MVTVLFLRAAMSHAPDQTRPARTNCPSSSSAQALSDLAYGERRDSEGRPFGPSCRHGSQRAGIRRTPRQRGPSFWPSLSAYIHFYSLPDGSFALYLGREAGIDGFKTGADPACTGSERSHEVKVCIGTSKSLFYMKIRKSWSAGNRQVLQSRIKNPEAWIWKAC